MTRCNVIGCDSTTDSKKAVKKGTKITVHRLPTNETLRKKWLERIGNENIRWKSKYIHICSLHFDESNFNRTLNITKLKDDSLPSRIVKLHAELETSINKPNSSSSTSIVSQESDAQEAANSAVVDTPTNKQKQLDTGPLKHTDAQSMATLKIIKAQNKIIQKLKVRCQRQAKKIHILQQTERRQKEKLAKFSKMIAYLKNNKVKETESDDFVRVMFYEAYNAA